MDHLRVMGVNSNKPKRWKDDIARSVDFYNDWFMKYAPKVYRKNRVEASTRVRESLKLTDYLTSITPEILQSNPSMLPTLRMATAPPIARDRLIGLAGVSRGLVKKMEVDRTIPPKMNATDLETDLQKIAYIIMKMADRDLLPWLEDGRTPKHEEAVRSSLVIADRLCGTLTNPMIRNAQEERQLALVKRWLEQRTYSYIPSGSGLRFDSMNPGTFAFHVNIPVNLGSQTKQVNIPVDIAIMPKMPRPDKIPLLIEAKSAGDYTNPNKRRKEEAMKVNQLHSTYGESICYLLLLCGYFDTGYLGYEAAEGIDWVWEHRIDDLAEFGV